MSEYIIRTTNMPQHVMDVINNWCEVNAEVVRCRDCKEFTFGSDEYATVDWCDYWGAYVESPDGFCAWGERRSE